MPANRARTIGTLAALLVALPFNLALVGGALVACAIAERRRAGNDRRTAARLPTDARKTIMLSGGKMTKALQLARSFHHAGHRVILLESRSYWLTGHRFSRAVDGFHIVPEPDDPGYAQALLDIAREEQVDFYVPVCSPVASLYDAQAIPLLQSACETVHVAPDQIATLDDKYRFAQAAKAMGLRSPRSWLITDPADLETFDFTQQSRPLILKSIAYDPVRRLDLTPLPRPTRAQTMAFVRSLPISPDNPWILQEFIAGTEYCTHGTMRDGELRVYCCCLSSAFQINYAHLDRPAIQDWVARFSKALRLTGQASFDFIEAADDGQTYAIECNPRTHSAITMFYNHPRLADAYLPGDLADAPLTPLASSRPTYWLYHEIWRLIAGLGSPRATRARLGTILRGKDAVFDWRDPLPFLMLHHWHIPLLLLRDLRDGRGWVRIDFNIGKLIQTGGD